MDKNPSNGGEVKLGLPSIKIKNGTLPVCCGEAFSFGRVPSAIYGDLIDMSLLTTKEESGITFRDRDVSPKEIVLVAWQDGRIMPAMLSGRFSLELPVPTSKGQRAFILNENGTQLITASLSSDGSDTVRILPRISLVSWALASGSNSAKQCFKYEILPNENGFILLNRKTGEEFVGKGDPEKARSFLWGFGLGGVLANFELERA